MGLALSAHIRPIWVSGMFYGCSALIDSLAGKKGSLRQAGMECKGMGGLGGTGRREGGEDKGKGRKTGEGVKNGGIAPWLLGEIVLSVNNIAAHGQNTT